jgi:G3E family GTPase
MILVGGFLGAGKTTLLGEAAVRLMGRGERVGIVTNDQATNLVDTALLAAKGIQVEEVAGGCFCCRFNDLESATSRLLDGTAPSVILAEPVGSCTDISATVLQPIKWLWSDRLRIGPFSVLTDPDRLRQALNGGLDSTLPESVLYIFRKQLEEADLIVINKADLLAPEELEALEREVAVRYPEAEVRSISALTGDGVDAWIERVLSGPEAGRKVVAVDYDTYAEGEAVLGWLNASAALSADRDVDWRRLAEGLIGGIRSALASRLAEIAHVKLLLETARGSVAANVTTTIGSPAVQGEIAGFPREAALVINARVRIGPDELRKVVENLLATLPGKGVAVEVSSIQSFSPSYPTPVHRFAEVVA